MKLKLVEIWKKKTILYVRLFLEKYVEKTAKDGMKRTLIKKRSCVLVTPMDFGCFTTKAPRMVY